MCIYTAPLKQSLQRRLLRVGTLKKPRFKARFKTLSTNVGVLYNQKKPFPVKYQLPDNVQKGKKKVKESIAVNGTPSHSYGVSLAVSDHTVLPATRHKRTHPAFTPARQAGTRFTDHLTVEG